MRLPRVIVFLLVVVTSSLLCRGDVDVKKKKKDIRDYTDADLEKLYDQWEEQEEPLEEDELPEYMRKPPPIDMSQMMNGDPESLLQASKKGRALITFVTVSGNPSKQETEEITALWQGSLSNAHIDTQRYMVEDHRAIFMFTDGAKAWEAKDFLIKQDRCEDVTIDGKSYPGKAAKASTSQKHKKEL